METMWNLWHGCHKVSEGCQHCYVYRGDILRGVDSNLVYKTKSFNLPLSRKRNGEYRIPAGTTLMTCFTSDFFIEEADAWRADAWSMMRTRSDLGFFIVTKRPGRIAGCLPENWGEGYDNVIICCTVENQRQVDFRLPIFKSLPIKHKCLISEPLLSSVDLSPWLDSWVEGVTVGGESGENARACNFDWVMQIHDDCLRAGVHFHFKQTGANFVKDGRCYKVERRFQMSQARRAGIDL